MYDVWYTVGLAVMRPELLDKIEAAGPVFNYLQRVVVEIGKGQRNVRPINPCGGLLENGPTTAVRQAISRYARAYSSSAPPIGIYCAGRFCQLCTIPYFDSKEPSSFKDIIGLANQAYKKAVGAGPESKLPAFPAFLGLCVMDPALWDLTTSASAVTDIAGEFGIPASVGSPEWKIATAFTGAPEFEHAMKLLMDGDNDPWQGGCTEQAIFWDGFNENAIQ